jgi:hypothetical protein
MAQAIQCLPNKWEDLSLNPSATKNVNKWFVVWKLVQHRYQSARYIWSEFSSFLCASRKLHHYSPTTKLERTELVRPAGSLSDNSLMSFHEWMNKWMDWLSHFCLLGPTANWECEDHLSTHPCPLHPYGLWQCSEEGRSPKETSHNSQEAAKQTRG